MRQSDLQEDRNGSVVLASSRHMKEEYEMNMTIPRAKVANLPLPFLQWLIHKVPDMNFSLVGEHDGRGDDCL